MADMQENSGKKGFQEIILNFLMRNLKVILLLMGVLLGTLFGFSSSVIYMKPNTKHTIGFLGDMLIQAMLSVGVPVISGGIISTFAILDLKTCRKISLRILLYLLMSKCCAAVLCVPLCLLVRPGLNVSGVSGVKTINVFSTKTSRRAVHQYLNIGRNLLPENWLEMFISHYESEILNVTDPRRIDFSVVLSRGPNLLGILVISCLVGIGLSRLGEDALPLTEAFTCFTKMCIVLSKLFVWLAPIGLLFIIFRDILEAPRSFDSISILRNYLAIFWSCCIIQLVLVHPIIYFIFTRKNPFRVFLNCPESFIISIVTRSSTGTLPVAMKELVENQKLDERIVKMVLPIGFTINKDGAFYMYAIGGLFEAQRSGIVRLDVIIVVLFLAFSMSMATRSAENQGLVLLIVLWSTLNFKHVDKDIGLFFLVEYINDRFRTVLQVFGNIFCASVIDNCKLLEDVDNNRLYP